MVFLGKACSFLLGWAALVLAQSAGATVVVEVSPVVHQAATFSATVRLPPSAALKKGGVEAEAYVVDKEGEEVLLVKRKLAVSVGGGVFLEHELEGLLIGCVSTLLNTNTTSSSYECSNRGAACCSSMGASGLCCSAVHAL